MYTALYRQERPETFEQVIGQDHVVRILKNQVKKNQVGHAYLFCGTRGTGKTSVARILAKAVNCTSEGERPCGVCDNCKAIANGNFLDVIEIDAASNNGIDSAREIRESVNYPPAVGRQKVYILDEAHEITPQAMNSLLKTLEEPPDNVMFILATTDPQKLLQTILSRCLRLDFHRIPDGQLKAHMKEICNKRGVDITEDALDLIASNADGSARDALSLLDQCLAGADRVLDRAQVIEYLGTASWEFFMGLTDAVTSGDPARALMMLDDILREGKDVKQILSDWMSYYRSLLIGKHIENPKDVLNVSEENIEKLSAQAKSISVDEINRSIMVLAETIRDARYSPQPRILMELAIVTLSSGEGAPVPKVQPKPAQSRNDDWSMGKAPAKQQAREQQVAAQPQATQATQQQVAQAAQPQVAQAPQPQEAQPQAAQASQPKADAAITNGWELSDIWNQVWDNTDDIGSLTMVRLASTLAEVKEEEFVVLFTSDIAMVSGERNKAVIEKAMSEIIGRPMKMTCKKSDSKEVYVQESMLAPETITRDDVEFTEPLSTEEDLKSIEESLNLSDINFKIEE